MAATKFSFVKTQGVWGFTALLVSAVSEWFLIILLLADAVLSYLLTKFASFCGLQAPCILCSRLEFALGGHKSDIYQTLFCSNHRSEISSLISCHIHNKVADGGGMCDDCLLSFKPKTKADSKAHTLLACEPGPVHGDYSFRCPFKGDFFPHSSEDSRLCTCCGSIAFHFVGKNSCDSLSYVGFTELKLRSDSEFSADDDYVSTVIHEKNEAATPKCQSTSRTSSQFLLRNSNLAEPEKTEAANVSQESDNGLQSIIDHEGSLLKITTNAELFEKTDLVKDDSHTSIRHKDKEELKLSSQKSSLQDSSISLLTPSGDTYPPETQAGAASSNGAKVLRKSVSLDSGLGSKAGSIVSKIEEDSLIDRYEQLHKELEEERNASAIATNEAMAMITRLQEEKAALKMEACQYQRMMEEQAEHDAVALEEADDLLSEKEKLIQDLEAELEFYRLNLVEETPMVENMHGESSSHYAANTPLQNVGLPHITYNINSSFNSIQAHSS